MKIKFINHASVIFSYGQINLICDPWIEGSVFHNAWSLTSKTKFKYENFKNITHIWFSHEHPDHFLPPNIKSISEEHRKNISVLYHSTNDKKVIKYLSTLNFKEVIELLPNMYYQLSKNFKVMSNSFNYDSWLSIRTDKHSVLNTNDCLLKTNLHLNNIKNKIGEVDLLLTQFSYASKHGNIEEKQLREIAAKDKLNQIKIQYEVLKPKIIIPFASFVWYSHEENFYMNDSVNKIDYIKKYLDKLNITPIIMYPGDEYELYNHYDNNPSIEKYITDYKNIREYNATKTISRTFNQLELKSKMFIEKVRSNSIMATLIVLFNPINIYITDLGISVKFSLLKGIVSKNIPENKIHFIASSEVIDFCFSFDWGFNTTLVNGRFQYGPNEGMKRINLYKSISDSFNHNDSVYKKIYRKILRNIGIDRRHNLFK